MHTPRKRLLIVLAALMALACLAFLPGLLAPNLATAALWVFSYVAAVVFLFRGIPHTSWYAPILMAACATSNFWEFRDDFSGHRIYSTTKATNTGHPYTVVDTSSAGTPTYTCIDGDRGLKVDFDSQSEAQNVCVAFGDQLQFDIDEIVEFYARVKLNVATPDSATSFAIGLTGDRNDAIDSIAQAILFRIIGSTAIVVESDDGTTDNDDVATGKTLSNSFVDLKISFACGKSDVRFFVNGQPVATGTTFDLSAYTGALQPFVQIQKTADTNTDGFTLKDWYVRGRNSLIAA